MPKLTKKQRMLVERKLRKQLQGQQGKGILGDLIKIVAPILIKEGAELLKKRKPVKKQRRIIRRTQRKRKIRRIRGGKLHPAGAIRMQGRGAGALFSAGSVRRVVNKPTVRRVVQFGGALAPAGTIRVARRTTPSLPNRPQTKIKNRK